MISGFIVFGRTVLRKDTADVILLVIVTKIPMLGEGFLCHQVDGAQDIH